MHTYTHRHIYINTVNTLIHIVYSFQKPENTLKTTLYVLNNHHISLKSRG